MDWKGLRRRLEESAAAIASEFEPDPENVRRVLEQRARRAAASVVEGAPAGTLEVLTFSLGGERYGVEAELVSEVCPLRDLTVVPCTPSFIAGVVSLRGQVLAITDLRRYFDLPTRGLTELNRVVVLREGRNEVGLLVDTIDGLHSVAPASLQASLPTLTGIRERFLKGVAPGPLVVLDGRLLLEDTSLIINEQVHR